MEKFNEKNEEGFDIRGLVHVLRRMLVVDPQQRPSASEVLAWSWWDDVRC